MNPNFDAPRPNRAMFFTLLLVSALSLLSVLSSGHEPYIDPAPLADPFAEVVAFTDPHSLPQTPTVVYSLDVLESGSRKERIGRQPLVAQDRAATFITGWSVDTGDGRPSLTVYTQVDTGAIRHALVFKPRLDVVRLYKNPDVLECGFTVPVDFSRVKSGRHKLTVWLTTSDGLGTARPVSLVVAVARSSSKPR